MSKSTVLTVVLFFGFFPFLQSQNHGPQAQLPLAHSFVGPIEQTTQKDSLAIWREQLHLHIDSERYRPKETLFFKAYVLTGPKQLRVSASDVLRVELLDAQGNLVLDQYHKIQQGAADGIMELPKTLTEGTYYLRAYTRWMLNYGEENLPLKEVLVSETKNSSDYKSGSIAIFPEGGHFVKGLENRAVLSESHGNPIHGTIVNEEGIQVANVMDYGSGLATFSFVPKERENYYFEKPNGDRIQLKQTFEIGGVLHANNIEDQKIQIRIGVTDELREGTYFLRGTRKGKEYLKSEITFDGDKDIIELTIKKEGLPHGLFNLTLVDAYGQVWAERPLYIDGGHFQFNLSQKSLVRTAEGEKIRYVLKLTDDNGKPISTDVTVRIKDVDNMAHNRAQASHPRGIGFLNDLKVLAQRFPEVPSWAYQNELPDQIKYAIQNGLEFYGQAYDFNNTLVIDDKVQVYIKNEKDVEVREVATNSEGLFALRGLQFEGDVTMTFRKDGKNIKEQLVKVIPYQYELPELKLNQVKDTAAPNRARKSGQMIPQKRLSDFDFKDKPSELIPLDEVTLLGQKKLRKANASVYGIEPDRVVYQDPKRPKPIPQLFLRVPGVYVSGIGDLNPSLSLPSRAGMGPVLWVIDGFPLLQASYIAGSGGGFSTFQPSPLREVMDIVPFVDVERIEFLFGPNAAIYGTRGSGGVILIYTKSGSYSTEFVARDNAQLTFKGFQSPIDIESYFISQNRRSANTKSASTLYWNPLLTTDENGEASFELVVPENLEQVLFDAKVITKEGKRGSFRALTELQSNN
ncbi:Plug domain-containing protein [Muricauda sp. SCSIO 64092]|uniref:TonB-dependent receptor n=1 Tax=Allomuricauda sp. SCSIO 64092 TaxID=2908842 RepID=UPI001FF2F7E2|nr:TonB-dependent receptor plug domain-containing protein [Muricauda sp. SCSIO 64092]UOY05714.1 Plug domain-containing protein [Muricauda sp. SCSIO 64092]